MKKGERMSEEHRLKIIESLTGRTVSQQTRDKISKSKKGVPRKPEHIEHHRKMMIGLKKGIPLSDKHRQSLREAKKKLLADPERGKKFREHLRAISPHKMPDAVWSDESMALRRGENHGMAKLTWDKVDEIRHMHENMGMSNPQIHRIVKQTHDVTLSTIKQVTSYRNWNPEKRPK
ncbi:hypothetical protein NS115_03650 [Paenibacillus jamilae]|uniref:Uncharacterized protein n=1 Tax=Paenibacillus jamilae TaxID=114136 RepID=A0ACC4ZZQ3_9BACL|nr:NUMOD3 domain-containing DNA-binding protein [Paenibacillus jamilae]KTS84438.1 hypothetical protein NS115_03650 [Paenibacillus jamilae]